MVGRFDLKEFRLACTCCAESSLQREDFLRFPSLVVRDNAIHYFSIAAIAAQTVHGSLHTLSIKQKWRMVVFWFFVVCSSPEAYLHTSPPQGHSTVGLSKC